MIRRTSWWRPLALAMALTGCGSASPPDSTDDHGAVEPDSGPVQLVLTAEAVRAAGIQTELVAAGGDGGATLTVPGEVESDPRRVALISPRAAGRLEALSVGVGDTVTAGQVVAWLASPPYLSAQADYVQAERRARLLAGTADSAGAAALLAGSARRLRMLGAGDDDLLRLSAGGEPELLLALTAPFGGSIVEALALAGAAAEPGTPVFRLIDLSELDVSADVPERALPQLAIGQAASVTLAAYPGQSFTGRVERIKDELDPTTRTVEALIHVRNPSRRLRPGMFATVELRVPSAGGPVLPAIPQTAVVTDGERRIAFVETAPGTYERRVLDLETTAGTSERIRVRGGVAVGERVVVRGAFVLKSEMAKAAMTEEH